MCMAAHEEPIDLSKEGDEARCLQLDPGVGVPRSRQRPICSQGMRRSSSTPRVPARVRDVSCVCVRVAMALSKRVLSGSFGFWLYVCASECTQCLPLHVRMSLRSRRGQGDVVRVRASARSCESKPGVIDVFIKDRTTEQTHGT